MEFAAVGAIAAFFEGFRQAGVDEDAQEGMIAALRGLIGLVPFGHDFAPREPAEGAVEAVQMEAADAAILRARHAWHPAAGRQHRGLVMFADLAAAMRADVADAFSIRGAVGKLCPLDAVRGAGAPLERLVFAAVRAGHFVVALVRAEKGGFDAAHVLCRRRARAQALAAGECRLAGFGEAARVAFAVDVEGVAVDLVEEEIAHRHRAQAGGAVGTGEGHEAAGEFLQQRRIGVVAALVVTYLALEHGRLVDHRREALAAVALGHVDRGLDDHDGARVGVGQVAEPVGADRGLAGLRAPHEHDFVDAGVR